MLLQDKSINDSTLSEIEFNSSGGDNTKSEANRGFKTIEMLAANKSCHDAAAVNSGDDGCEAPNKSCSLDNIFDTTDIAFADDEEDGDLQDGGHFEENAGNYNTNDVTNQYGGHFEENPGNYNTNDVTNQYGGGRGGNGQVKNAGNYRNVMQSGRDGGKALIAAARTTYGREKDDLTMSDDEMISKDTSEINNRRYDANNASQEKGEKEECGGGGVTSITPDIVKPVKGSCPANVSQGRFQDILARI